ncbi:MAG: hypothetical protein ABI462_05335 [Ignavibacteria bacterium]
MSFKTSPENDNSSVSTNIRIKPSSTILQVSPTITTHPDNPDIMVASAITTLYAGGYTTGFYCSTNGGISWNGTDAIRNDSNSILATWGDPTIIIDAQGYYIIAYNKYTGGLCRAGVSSSSNGGATWSNTVLLPGGGMGNEDKMVTATDRDPASPYFGRSYLSYRAGTGYIYTSFTTDHGITWSPVNNSGQTGMFPFLETGQDGVLYLVWSTIPLTKFSRSTDGGITWSSPVIITNQFNNIFIVNTAQVTGIPSMSSDKSGGPRNGWIYMVKEGIGKDYYDLMLYTSTDQGDNWTKTKVNQCIETSLNYQFFPAINVDENGGVNIVYGDTRNFPLNDSAQMYLSRSLDGGITFSDILVSDHSYPIRKPDNGDQIFGLPAYTGAYIGITSNNNKIFPVWNDNSSGKYNLWTASVENNITIGSVPLENTTQITGSYDVVCKINSIISSIDGSNTKLFWSVNNTQITDSTEMINNDTVWTASIPASGYNSVYRYYIKTANIPGEEITFPDLAPRKLVTFNSFNSVSLNLKVIPQGFYNTTTGKLNSNDTVKVYLRNAASPYGITDSSFAILDSLTFSAHLIFSPQDAGFHFIQVTHRNSIETWSRDPVYFSNTIDNSYNFTDSAGKAYERNQIRINDSPVRYGMYSGDVNKDKIINLSDVLTEFNANTNFIKGYTDTDITGDNIVNLSDVIITFNNCSTFIGVLRP